MLSATNTAKDPLVGLSGLAALMLAAEGLIGRLNKHLMVMRLLLCLLGKISNRKERLEIACQPSSTIKRHVVHLQETQVSCKTPAQAVSPKALDLGQRMSDQKLQYIKLPKWALPISLRVPILQEKVAKHLFKALDSAHGKTWEVCPLDVYPVALHIHLHNQI